MPTFAAACILVLSCLGLSPAAHAGTIKVSSGVAADLQSAINAAGPGDTIALKGGPYEGGFSIPAGKDGLTLKGKATIAAYAVDHAFEVDSHGVSFVGLTISLAKAAGIWGPTPGSTLAGMRISKCRFVACKGNPVQLNADDVVIESCEAIGCDGTFFVVGARALFRKLSVRNGAAGIQVLGDDAQLLDLDLRSLDNFGVFITGDRAEVSKARVEHIPASWAILVIGKDAVVTSNDVRSADLGVNVMGDAATVSRNRVEDCLGTAMSVSGLGSSVTQNQIVDAESGLIVASTFGAIVEANRVEGCTGDGLYVPASGATIRKNRVARCGSSGDYGLFIKGDENEVEANTATECTWIGIGVQGLGNVFTGNTSTNNGHDGFLVEANSQDTSLVGNKASGNGAEGLENQGAGTSLEKNSFTGNVLLDVSNATGDGATLVDGGGNKFKTGGLTTEPKVKY